MDESKKIEILENKNSDNFQVKNTLELAIDNYEGPLDLLLDLAKTQKVDLMQISIVQLVDQYIAYVDKIKKNFSKRVKILSILISVYSSIWELIQLPIQ